MRGRPPHPSEQSWDQIFGAPADGQPTAQRQGGAVQNGQYPGQPAPQHPRAQHPQFQQPAPQQAGQYAQYPQNGPRTHAPQQQPGQVHGVPNFGGQRTDAQYSGYAQQGAPRPDGFQHQPYEPLGMRMPEQTIMRVRRHGRRLLLPSLVLILGFAAAGYNLGALQETTIGARHAWLLVSLAAIVLLGIVPIVVWLQARNRITTHRVVISQGTLTSETREIAMNAIVDVTVRRNLWQAMFRSGTIVITSVSGHRLRLVDVPSANTVAACIRELSGP